MILLLVGVTKGNYPGADMNADIINEYGYLDYVSFRNTDFNVSYNADVDPINYGYSYGLPRRNASGGHYNFLLCGSRCGIYESLLVRTHVAFAARGCKENKNILGRLLMR